MLDRLELALLDLARLRYLTLGLGGDALFAGCLLVRGRFDIGDFLFFYLFFFNDLICFPRFTLDLKRLERFCRLLRQFILNWGIIDFLIFLRLHKLIEG